MELDVRGRRRRGRAADVGCTARRAPRVVDGGRRGRRRGKNSRRRRRARRAVAARAAPGEERRRRVGGREVEEGVGVEGGSAGQVDKREGAHPPPRCLMNEEEFVLRIKAKIPDSGPSDGNFCEVISPRVAPATLRSVPGRAVASEVNSAWASQSPSSSSEFPRPDSPRRPEIPAGGASTRPGANPPPIPRVTPRASSSARSLRPPAADIV